MARQQASLQVLAPHGRTTTSLDRQLASLDDHDETCINPDAPWTTFIDARSRALSAYGLFQDSRRQHGLVPAVTLDNDAETRSAAQRERLSAAFVRLSLALDRVTVPILYWSESPYEAVGSAASHTALVHVLDECELRLRRIADKDSAQGEVPRALDGRQQELDGDEDSLESLTAWMHIQAGLLEPQASPSSLAIDRIVPSLPLERPVL